MIGNILESNGINVIAEAADGREAVQAVVDHRPDVVTMDLNMPRMDGLDAIERIMDREPTPILVLSSLAEKDAEITFEALNRGAVDFFQKPGGEEVTSDIALAEDRLIDTIESVVHSTPPTPDAEPAQPRTEPKLTSADESPILAIAASTGGPAVVEAILSELPSEANLRIVIVQHMPASFTERFADRLDRSSAYHVTEAKDGQHVSPGEAVLAPGDYHLLVEECDEELITVSLDAGEAIHNVKPAADVTFSSLAECEPDNVIATVATGMGSDGAAGVVDLSDSGAKIIAQDEPTSAVFGMPQRAIETGCVDEIVPKEDLASTILDYHREFEASQSSASQLGVSGGNSS